MAVEAKERCFEEDIEAFLTSETGGYLKSTDKESFLYDDEWNYQAWDGHGYFDNRGKGVDIKTLVSFVRTTQPKAWERFEKLYGPNLEEVEKKYLKIFDNAVDTHGMIHILKNGFKHRGIQFRVICFKPESGLNETALQRYKQNVCRCIRQFHFAAQGNQTIDMVLDINGIPLVGIELKDQFNGQDVDDAKLQWQNRDHRETPLKFNKRMVAFFAVDLDEVYMTTSLEGDSTYFLPFNQGSNGAGNDGGKGNPSTQSGLVKDYPSEHLWKVVLQKDSLLEIIQKFLHLEVKEEKYVDKNGDEKTKKSKRIIFPRYHQLDSVRGVVESIRRNGAGTNFLIQHSAGSGKSNSIAWLAYRLASLFDLEDKPIFDSVIVITDRKVLDAQLQDTISGFEHAVGSVCVIDAKKTSKDLRDALNDGKRLVVSTIQKFPVIFDEVESGGKSFAVIVDEAHSSQKGENAIKLKKALADIEEPLQEWEEIEAEQEDREEDVQDALVKEMSSHGKQNNLTFCAFTATPKEETLETFGVEHGDGTFHPFHIYSMRQAVEEEFILDPLLHYVSYHEAVELTKTIPDNPDVPSSPTMKLLRRYKELHPYAIGQKAAVLVEVYRDITKNAIKGKGKMMVVTSSRLATVRYYYAIKAYMQEQGYDDLEILVAFSGTVIDPAVEGVEYSEPSMNIGHDGNRVKESQTRKEFHDHGNILVVADKFQTGFDEPLLHTLVVDKKLRDIKAVQTICRVNRIHPDKEDTLVLDFVNSPEDIQDAFQKFYNEVTLTEQINTDLIYKTQTELHDYGVYTVEDIERASAIEFDDLPKDNIQGKMVLALKPAVLKYEALSDENKQYQFRRKVRSFCKWYSYITQIARMFDVELHKEYIFLKYLSHFLTAKKINVESIDDKIAMKFYKLEKDFEGSLALSDTSDPLEPGAPGGDADLDKRKDPLQELIDRINLQYLGDFSEADKVIVQSLYDRIVEDNRVADSVRNDGEVIFKNNTFPKIFDEQARKAYVEQTDAFTSIFEDGEKYTAIMDALASLLFKRLSE